MTDIRTFETGATRDIDTDKYDYEGFLSPLVMERFAKYMHQNRLQKDGSLRASDNWQKGIPLNVYIKSAWRHFMEWWKAHRSGRVDEEALCALLFNVQGYLHEVLIHKPAPVGPPNGNASAGSSADAVCHTLPLGLHLCPGHDSH